MLRLKKSSISDASWLPSTTYFISPLCNLLASIAAKLPANETTNRINYWKSRYFFQPTSLISRLLCGQLTSKIRRPINVHSESSDRCWNILIYNWHAERSSLDWPVPSSSRHTCLLHKGWNHPWARSTPADRGLEHPRVYLFDIKHFNTLNVGSVPDQYFIIVHSFALPKHCYTFCPFLDLISIFLCMIETYVCTRTQTSLSFETISIC